MAAKPDGTTSTERRKLGRDSLSAAHQTADFHPLLTRARQLRLTRQFPVRLPVSTMGPWAWGGGGSFLI